MNLLGILIGTGILWLLKAVAVFPLANYLNRKKLAKATVASSPVGEGEAAVATMDTKLYILADMLVLGTAGLLMGLIAGWFFIGITWQWKGWPGMLAFIGLSIVGSIIHG